MIANWLDASKNQALYLTLAEGLADFKLEAGLAEELATGEGDSCGEGEGEVGVTSSTEASIFKGVDRNRFLSHTK